MRERHVAHAQVVEIAQQAQAVFDGVAAFDPNQRGDLMLIVRLADARRAGDEQKIVGILFDDIVPYGIDHLQRAIRRFIVLSIARGDVRGEELRAHAALLHARDIGHVSRRGGLADIHSIDREAGDVVMSVDESGGAMDAHHFLIGHGPLLAPRRLGHGDRRQESCEDGDRDERLHCAECSTDVLPVRFQSCPTAPLRL